MTMPVSPKTNETTRFPIGAESEAEGRTKFSSLMKTVGKFAVAAGRAAVTMIPGASAVTSFFDSYSGESFTGSYDGMTPMEMLGIQREMLQESRLFTLVSNVMRIRHDAAMNALRNIK